MTKNEAIELSQKCPGWCTPEKAERLYDLVIEMDGTMGTLVTVELGVFGGRSLFAMAFAHQAIGKGVVCGFDAWDNVAPLEGTNAPENNEWWASVPMDEIEAGCRRACFTFGLGDVCSLVKVRTDYAAEIFFDGTITLLHQDSNHNEETITRELELWAPKMKTGGFWVVDDSDWPETKAGYAEFGFELVEDHKSWQIWRKK